MSFHKYLEINLDSCGICGRERSGFAQHKCAPSIGCVEVLEAVNPDDADGSSTADRLDDSWETDVLCSSVEIFCGG